MNYLLDTCILSEFTHHKPDDKVIRWVDSVVEDRLYLSVISNNKTQRPSEKNTQMASIINADEKLNTKTKKRRSI